MCCWTPRVTVFCSFLTCLCLNLSSTARCRLVSVSIFVALVCSTPRVALLVVHFSLLSQPFLLCVEHLDSLCSLFSCLWQLSKLSKYSYFRRTVSCKLLSSLPIAFPSAHVSFAWAFEYFDLFLIAFNSVSTLLLSVLLLLLSSVNYARVYTQRRHARVMDRNTG